MAGCGRVESDHCLVFVVGGRHEEVQMISRSKVSSDPLCRWRCFWSGQMGSLITATVLMSVEMVTRREAVQTLTRLDPRLMEGFWPGRLQWNFTENQEGPLSRQRK